VVSSALDQHDLLDPAPGTPTHRPGAQPGPRDRPRDRRRPPAPARRPHPVVGVPAFLGGQTGSAVGPVAGGHRRYGRWRPQLGAPLATASAAPTPGGDAQTKWRPARKLAAGTGPAPFATSSAPVMTRPPGAPFTTALDYPGGRSRAGQSRARRSVVLTCLGPLRRAQGSKTRRSVRAHAKTSKPRWTTARERS
jgi:hypothetical protein